MRSLTNNDGAATVGYHSRRGSAIADRGRARGKRGEEVNVSGLFQAPRSLQITRDGGALTGPTRRPAEMLAEQKNAGAPSIHDDEVAAKLGLAGAPIEGPTHFSQIDPLGFSLWGQGWLESGCISSHFRTMVVEGEFHIIDCLTVGDRVVRQGQRIDMTTSNGDGYPFSLRQKLDRITEPSQWYESGDNPWGRWVVPFEMYSVLTDKSRGMPGVRRTASGLFVELEVRAVDGPVFVDQEYIIEKELLCMGQSRRVESY